MPTRNVVLLAFDGLNLLDLTGPLEAFFMASHWPTNGAAKAYQITVGSLQGGPVQASSGLEINSRPCPPPEEIDTLIVPGGGGGPTGIPAVPQELVQWIARAAPHIRRVCSVCTGAFILASSGLLRGQRVSTHWAAATRLQARFPDIRVDAEPIFIRDGQLWTSAGVTAGIDLALALIDEDLGYDAAMTVARHLVVFMRRSDNQSQFSAPLALQIASDRSFARLHSWMREHLQEDLCVERLAAHTNMSVRSFTRMFREKTGATPARTVERLRIEAACTALERSDVSLKQIARDCGFGDEKSLRRAFIRVRGETPLAYRSRMQEHGAAATPQPV